MKDYSQFQEQPAILEAFGYRAGDDGVVATDEVLTNTRFLDIGAWHPTDKSNSRALIELGWSGVLFEPTPGNMINLLRCCTACGEIPKVTVIHKNGSLTLEYEPWGMRHGMKCDCGTSLPRYGANEALNFIQAAVDTVPGMMELWVSDDAISTNSAEEHERWEKVGGYFGRVMVPVITLEQIAAQFGGFDMWNIDAEGHSAELFLQALQLGYRPRVFCVEHDGRTTELLNAATREGYKATLVNSTNLVVVR